ncbi:MAG: hypothetical protein KF764_25480 [Labilithrix sp.]|nr:hypothetical protein [Labilithrix sp.]
MRNAKPPDDTKKKQSASTQPPDGEGGDPKYVTEEQLSHAIAARFASFERKVSKANDGLVSTLTTKLEELVSGKLETGQNPKEKALQRQLNDAQKQLERERSTVQRQRDRELRQKLGESLSAAGITGSALKSATAWLVDGEKSVRLDDEGEEVIFRDTDGCDLPLAVGMKRWLKTDDAKIYLRAREQGGASESRGGKTSKGSEETDLTLGRALRQMAFPEKKVDPEAALGRVLLDMADPLINFGKS